VAESGWIRIDYVVWRSGARSPPKQAISRLSVGLASAIQQVTDELDKQGLSPAVMDAEQFAAFIRAELQKNEKVARHANLRVD
jgi:tripartite-type tricarboxylate transporter receptor subunit TctC